MDAMTPLTPLTMTALPTIVPVVMAGGSGTRLWPLSREQYPKQFLSLVSERSLLQETVLRATRIENAIAPVVIGADAHRFLLAEQLRDVGIRNVTMLLEPESRNTAPAAAAAAHYVAQEYGPEALVLLLSADHTVSDEARFQAAIRTAAEIAARARIVIFGIQPTRPETGFGYIKAGPPIENAGADVIAHEVAAFIEKPPLEKALAFLDEGGYYWNGGMFMFRADRFLADLWRLEPQLCDHALEALRATTPNSEFIRLEPNAFRACRKDSVDYALIEKTADLAMVPLDAGWDDLGCWTFLGELPATDTTGNRIRGDVVLQGAEGNLVHASARLVALVGVKDHVVVETADAVLVTTKDRAQDVKRVVQDLKSRQRIEAEAHPRVYRPWGFYETVAQGERFQVKRILVRPGHKLSLQMHHHRAEHWVVVKGTARVTCGEKVFLLTEDQSTYIPLGHTHRLENPGKVPLELIEVQSGPYLGEDDIVRFEDVYGRTPAPAETSVPAGAAERAEAVGIGRS